VRCSGLTLEARNFNALANGGMTNLEGEYGEKIVPQYSIHI
jgi:hypothetical protein